MSNSEQTRWNLTTFTLIRWQSIRTLYMTEQLFNLNIQKKKKAKKKYEKKNFEKKSNCHISNFF